MLELAGHPWSMPRVARVSLPSCSAARPFRFPRPCKVRRGFASLAETPLEASPRSPPPLANGARAWSSSAGADAASRGYSGRRAAVGMNWAGFDRVWTATGRCAALDFGRRSRPGEPPYPLGPMLANAGARVGPTSGLADLGRCWPKLARSDCVVSWARPHLIWRHTSARIFRVRLEQEQDALPPSSYPKRSTRTRSRGVAEHAADQRTTNKGARRNEAPITLKEPKCFCCPKLLRHHRGDPGD